LGAALLISFTRGRGEGQGLCPLLSAQRCNL